MKGLIVFTIFFCVSITFSAQLRSFIKKEEMLQSLQAKKGILLMPLFENEDTLVHFGNQAFIKGSYFNSQMKKLVAKHYTFSEVLFYFFEHENDLLDSTKLLSVIIDENLHPCVVDVNEHEWFIGKIYKDGYKKNLNYLPYFYRRKSWILKEKFGHLIEEKELSPFQQEIAVFESTDNKPGITISRLHDKVVMHGKKKKFFFNFQTFYPIHFSLPDAQVFQRLGESIDEKRNTQYTKSVEFFDLKVVKEN